MSHTSKISTVEIRDIHALRAACDELRTRQGVNLRLEENVVPRAYFPDQADMTEAADYVVRLPDISYDVGLYRNAEGTGYEARADLFMDEVQSQLGCGRVDGATHEQRALGKLFNLYSVHAAMRAAVAQGLPVQRIDKEDGEVQLVVSLAA